MDRGRLIAQGTVAELTSRGARTAYLEVDDVAAAKRVLSGLTGVTNVHDAMPGIAVDLDGVERGDVVRSLVQAGVRVDTVMQRHRLEDVFVGLVGEETMRQ
jgi:ABC-type multidrug transport system ATPase subunit